MKNRRTRVKQNSRLVELISGKWSCIAHHGRDYSRWKESMRSNSLLLQECHLAEEDGGAGSSAGYSFRSRSAKAGGSEKAEISAPAVKTGHSNPPAL